MAHPASTVVDMEHADYRALARVLGLTLDTAGPTGGFTNERDWFYYAKGRGAPAGGRWLVTLAYPDSMRSSVLLGPPDQPQGGWLVAYEIDHDDKKTNRIIVLAGPWDLRTDGELHDRCRLVDPDLDDLVGWLRDNGA